MVFSLAVTASRWAGLTQRRCWQPGPPGQDSSSVWHLWSIWYPLGMGATHVSYAQRWAMTFGLPGLGWNLP